MLYRSNDCKNAFTAAFIFVVAVHAHLAGVLTEPLCKLQSEAGLGLLAYSLGKVVRREKTDLRLAHMENAEIAFDIYTAYAPHLRFHRNTRTRGSKPLAANPILNKLLCLAELEHSGVLSLIRYGKIFKMTVITLSRRSHVSHHRVKTFSKYNLEQNCGSFTV